MPAHFVYADQHGLTDEEGHPTGECGAVNPEQEGPRRGSVEETVIDRTTEAPHHQSGEQQRHQEVKISVHEPLELVRGARSSFSDRYRPYVFCGNERDRHKVSLSAGVAGIALPDARCSRPDLRLDEPGACGSMVTWKTADVSGNDPVKAAQAAIEFSPEGIHGGEKFRFHSFDVTAPPTPHRLLLVEA